MEWAGWLLLAGFAYYWWTQMGGLISPTIPATSKGIQALAVAIATAEGFGVAGAIPTVRHNPGDLTDGSGTIRTFPTDDDGWTALYHFLGIIASGSPSPYTGIQTIQDLANIYTATDPNFWAVNVATSLTMQGFPATPSSPVFPILTA